MPSTKIPAWAKIIGAISIAAAGTAFAVGRSYQSVDATATAAKSLSDENSRELQAIKTEIAVLKSQYANLNEAVNRVHADVREILREVKAR